MEGEQETYALKLNWSLFHHVVYVAIGKFSFKSLSYLLATLSLQLLIFRQVDLELTLHQSPQSKIFHNLKVCKNIKNYKCFFV